MGREAKIRKRRKCHVCELKVNANAKEFKEHVKQCERLTRLGLVRG